MKEISAIKTHMTSHFLLGYSGQTLGVKVWTGKYGGEKVEGRRRGKDPRRQESRDLS